MGLRPIHCGRTGRLPTPHIIHIGTQPVANILANPQMALAHDLCSCDGPVQWVFGSRFPPTPLETCLGTCYTETRESRLLRPQVLSPYLPTGLPQQAYGES